MDIQRIEDKIDKTAAGATPIDMSLGGVRFQSMMELLEFAKLMAVSDLAVPPHLRGNPGACLAVCTKALRFGFDPFSLAEHSYSMVKRQKVDDRWVEVEAIAYDSFVIRAVIEAHAPLTGKMEYAWEGEGEARKCTVTMHPKNSKPIAYTSPTLGDLKAMRGRNDKGQIRGSQLWDSAKSDVQQAYDTGRDACRIHFPHILLGWYDKDEFDGPKDVTPKEDKPSVGNRLKGQKGARGFSAEHVERETAALPAPTETAITTVEGADGAQVTIETAKEPVAVEAAA